MFEQTGGKVRRQRRRNQLLTGAPLLFAGNIRNDEHTIEAGLNYHLNLGGSLIPR
jgi:hypothetical protein